MKSWKTTLTGIGAVLGGIAIGLKAIAVGDFSKLPEVIAAVTAGIGLIAARDNSVSSEAAGAK